MSVSRFFIVDEQSWFFLGLMATLFIPLGPDSNWIPGHLFPSFAACAASLGDPLRRRTFFSRHRRFDSRLPTRSFTPEAVSSTLGPSRELHFDIADLALISAKGRQLARRRILTGRGGCSLGEEQQLVHQGQASARRTQWAFCAGDTRADQYCPPAG